MKLIDPVNVQVMSRRSFRRPAALFEAMAFFEEALPQIKPSVFNWTDPVNKPWDLSKLESYIPDDRAGEADTIYWRKKRTPKASGYFTVASPVNAAPQKRWHGDVSFVVELANLDVAAVVSYIKAATLKFDGDIAQVHWVSPKEKPDRETEYSFDMAGANGGSEFGTNSLHHWLPALPWAVVFGDAYVRMFGMERLLSAPAYKVEKLSDDAVYIQLSQNLTDLQTDYEAVHAARERVQEHLGRDAFFDVKKAYPLRGPIGEMPAEQFLKALAEFRCPEPGSTGMRVPEFRFIPD